MWDVTCIVRLDVGRHIVTERSLKRGRGVADTCVHLRLDANCMTKNFTCPSNDYT